ncbi:ABC transporter substrate-binding protein [Motilimonas pumila]|uniref:Iron-siderophore ABC transporter substrate-binding protein n=1 Tax=Motilimonas pumila TaxID=2303987 RepID=A0A418Y9M6_9GAMM|nr:ABC transporter substrate-binding protein [Motilimonas pumila]RJG37977.1 iron-siderophore ABC transporter substrate-binding protein [Motilimonas pumila]
MSLRMHWRWLILLCLPVLGWAKTTANVVVIDWTHAETLLALGITPSAVPQIADYNAWVKAPQLPCEVADIGLRTQPNLESVSERAPEKILLSPMYQALLPRLSEIAPVEVFGLYKEGEVNWHAMENLTKALATAVGHEALALPYIAAAQQQMQGLRAQISSQDIAPLLMVQFMDANHVRVFAKNSLYQTAADELGLENAWPKATNAWGFALVGIDDLIGIKPAQIVVVEPLPFGSEQTIADNALWQHLVSQSGNQVWRLPAVWSFGALPSTVRFASELVGASLRVKE